MRRLEWVFEVEDVSGAIEALKRVNPQLDTLAAGQGWSLLDDTNGPVWFAVGNGRVVMRRISRRKLRPGDAEQIEAYITALRAVTNRPERAQ
jgi:hypothetical protein